MRYRSNYGNFIVGICYKFKIGGRYEWYKVMFEVLKKLSLLKYVWIV